MAAAEEAVPTPGAAHEAGAAAAAVPAEAIRTGPSKMPSAPASRPRVMHMPLYMPREGGRSILAPTRFPPFPRTDALAGAMAVVSHAPSAKALAQLKDAIAKVRASTLASKPAYAPQPHRDHAPRAQGHRLHRSLQRLFRLHPALPLHPVPAAVLG
jgi:hypothetical protein